MSIFKSKIEKLAERSEDTIQKIYYNKDKLIDKYGELSELKNKLQNETEKYILDSIIYQLQTIFMVSGYDAEMLSMILLIKKEYQHKVWNINKTYRENNRNAMAFIFTYMVTIKPQINDSKIQDVILESSNIIRDMIISYNELEEISKL